MYERKLNLEQLLGQKSHFLFGARATGKSTLIRSLDSGAIEVVDLLERDTYRRLLQKPSILESLDQSKIIVIDEIQKIPSLLDEVHRLMTKYDTKFLLTGSSARKLRYGSSNLLAGRAWKTELFPLSWSEITDFDLERYLTRGGLPQSYKSKYWQKELSAYVTLYLREEIAAEALTRNLESFSEFLDLIAQSNGQEINFQSFATDCGVTIPTIKNYFSIIEDTLLGFSLSAFTKTRKRKAITRSKHYLFDVGVVNSLCEIGGIKKKSPYFGNAFEHFIVSEVRAANTYLEINAELSYWRSTSQFEVDLIIGKKVAIEIKSSAKVQAKYLKGLKALQEENLLDRFILVSLDKFDHTTEEGIECLHWETFLSKLWKKEI